MRMHGGFALSTWRACASACMSRQHMRVPGHTSWPCCWHSIMLKHESLPPLQSAHGRCKLSCLTAAGNGHAVDANVVRPSRFSASLQIAGHLINARVFMVLGMRTQAVAVHIRMCRMAPLQATADDRSFFSHQLYSARQRSADLRIIFECMYNSFRQACAQATRLIMLACAQPTTCSSAKTICDVANSCLHVVCCLCAQQGHNERLATASTVQKRSWHRVLGGTSEGKPQQPSGPSL